MSGRRGFLKGLVGWVCGWSGAWRTAVGTGVCSLGTLCHGHPTALPTEELPRKEGSDTTSLGPGLEPPGAVSAAKPTGTLKRPTSLSRHASAAGFPLSGASAWTLGRGYRSPLSAASPAEPLAEGPSPDATEDVSHLLADVARFAEGLEKLKECVLRDDLLEARRPLAHECLSEAIRVMRQVIAKYPLLSTVETLAAACNLIAKIKAFHYESNNESDKQEFEKALETIAVTFSSSVSELLLGEVDSSTLLSVPPGDPCQSMENLYEQGSESASASTTEDWESSLPPPEEVDMLLQRCEGGVEAALQYSKNMAKYMKDLIGYLDKRAVLEMDFAKGLQKIVQNCRQSITQEPHMPLLSIYSLALEQDLDFGHGLMQAVSTLQTQTFIQPLNQRRLEHEKRRKEIKDMWQRAQRKLQEAESNLRKAKQGYVQRCEDHDKARSLVAKAEEEQASSAPGAGGTVSKALDKRRRLEEEAKNKAEEAMATYRTCVADAKTQKQELEDTKVTVLRQIQEVIRQSDQTIKSVTISYYQMMQVQTAPLPVHFQMLCESSKLYDPGHQYASHVRQLQRGEEPYVHYDFEPHIPTNAWSPVMQVRKGSFSGGDTVGAEAAGTPPEEGVLAKEPRSGRGHKVHKSWPTSVSDPESGLDPNTGSAGDFKKYERTSSSGTMSSSEELTEQEGGTGAATFEQEDLSAMAPELPVAVPSGPFRHVGLSKAARTHRLRKLRTPAKCRECNSYVYFQGAECEECCLACHKKCLETLAIQCGHKKLQGRLQLFGQDFGQAARSTPDGVPFIIKKCIGEIEKRALHTKGIYRVNGVKTRVEKLCQAFENGKELVELSQAPPHDISNVLKLYLRQLPEPLISFRFYHELVGLAKDSLKAEAEIKAASRGRPDVAESEAAAVAMASRLRELLQDLPYENRTTLKYLLCHLRKIVEVEQDNKMTPGNLGIVFGPTLLRPRPTEATVSLSSLVDYPHQARIVETLIAHYGLVFEEDPEEVPGVPMREDGPANQRAEVVVQVSYSESGEEAEDAGQESHVAFNDSDSELDETPDPLDSSVDSALQHLSFLEARAGPEVENNEGPLGDQGAEAGAERELWDGISGYNSNQSNNKQLTARLPTVRVRRGRVAVAGSLDRQPQFV